MDIIRNLYLHKYSHKMFYKTKPPTRRSSGSSTVTAQNDELRSQPFYIYSIDGRSTGHSNTPNVHLDLPPKYDDVIKDPNYVRREVS
ncbi:CLUMA_CG007220, isoform B [Clunio marinus]|uniref:CLUMA_CG007220, isoform B n=1 Tax=Clunio marinus TaxID=568069 RepID=A0A1J1I276_9DIPT|nr:CLUMA_CG007220, isoform B [Clunio marinus]